MHTHKHTVHAQGPINTSIQSRTITLLYTYTHKDVHTRVTGKQANILTSVNMITKRNQNVFTKSITAKH